MSEQLEGRIVNVGGEQYIVYDMDASKAGFSKLYQSKETLALDERFGLTGESVDKNSNVANDIRLATGPSSLGKTEVEIALRYFGLLAMKAGNFIGLPEDELRDHLAKGDITLFDEGCLNIALGYRDGMHDGAAYLVKKEVEGKKVLFPANLPKLLF